MPQGRGLFSPHNLHSLLAATAVPAEPGSADARMSTYLSDAANATGPAASRASEYENPREGLSEIRRQKQLQHGIDLKQQATEQRSQRETERRLGTPAGAPAGGYHTIDNQSHSGGGGGGHWIASAMAPFGNDANIAGG